MFSLSCKSLLANADAKQRAVAKVLSSFPRKFNSVSRSVGLTLAATFAFGCGTANAVDFVTEDWESGTPPAGWPCKNAPSSCTRSSFNGWGNIVADYCPDAAYWSTTGVSNGTYTQRNQVVLHVQARKQRL